MNNFKSNISIIIAVRGIRQSLKDCMQGFLDQTVLPLEVILVGQKKRLAANQKAVCEKRDKDV